MRRMVIVTVDTLVEVLKDYLGEENVPRDAQVVRMLVKPAEQGKFAIVIDSPSIPYDAPAVTADFQVKRFYSVGEPVVGVD